MEQRINRRRGSWDAYRAAPIPHIAAWEPPTSPAPLIGPSSISGPVSQRLLRIQDAARYLGATNWFVEELVRKKQIRSLVLGKRRVIDVRDLDAWIESEKGRAA
jgi:excisionase family DNA binding protein